MSQKRATQYFILMIAIMLFLAAAIPVYAIDSNCAEPPKWITELEYKPDVIETVGYTVEGASIELAFNRADFEARKEMANVLSALIKSSIEDSVIIRRTLDSETIKTVYRELISLYADEVMSGVSIVARYIDPETGMIYSLARMNRTDAIEDASKKARLAIRGNKSLFDELVIDSEIRSRLKPQKVDFIEATGFASVSSDEYGNIKPISYEGAMMYAELNARSALAQHVRVRITNDVQSWVEEHRDSFDSNPSIDHLLESISKAFTEVKLEGSRIMKRHFSPETKMIYAQAVMDRKWLAREFSHAAAPAIDKSGKTELADDLNRVIHNSLDILIKGADGR